MSALLVLLLNDFALKSAWPGVLTGKLSDFVGLFALGVFLLVFTHRRGSLLVLAACFTVWKLPLSGPLIQAWNAAGGWTIGRTVDPTDLVALAVLPLAWRFYRTAEIHASTYHGAWRLSLLVSLFAFTATSRGPDAQQRVALHSAVAEFEFNQDAPGFYVPLSRKEVYRALETGGFLVNGSVAVSPHFGQHSAAVYPREDHFLSLETDADHPELWMASFVVEEGGSGVTLRLTKVSVKRNGYPVTRQEALKIFEGRVMAALR